LLLALVTAGVMVMQIRTNTFRCLALGIIAGLAVGIKIHAALYFIPLGIFVLVRAPDAKAAILYAVIGATGFTGCIVAAFAADPCEVMRFGRYIAVISRHGLEPRLLFLNLLSGLALTAPYIIALWQRRASLARDRRTLLTAVSALLSVSLVIVVGAKPGSGPHHLMPLIPVLLFLTMTLNDAIESTDTLLILIVAMIAAALAPLKQTVDFLRLEIKGIGDTITAQREAVDLVTRYPGAQFGPTDSEHYATLKNRVVAALSGAKLTFDLAAWMDLDFAGIRPSDDPADFSPGPRVWILPRDGAPFSMYSFYNYYNYATVPLFSTAFQNDFHSRCQQIDVRRTFAAWFCKLEGRISPPPSHPQRHSAQPTQ